MKKQTWIAVIAAVLVLLLISGVVYTNRNFALVEGKFYSRNETVLDLRDQEVTVELYKQLQAELPYTRIRWNVPFQGRTYPDDVKELTLNALTEADSELLGLFPELEVIHAVDFQDVTALLKAELRWRNITFDYTASLGGEPIDREAAALTLSALSEEELVWLDTLDKLETVAVSGTYCDAYAQLEDYCASRGIPFTVVLGGENVAMDTAELTLTGATDGELSLLKLLPNLRKLHLVGPTAEPDTVLGLEQAYPGVQVSWEADINGKLFDSKTKEVDISGMAVTDLEQIEQNMRYLPQAEKLIIEDLTLDNELLAAYRERARSQYKVVWTVWCGDQVNLEGEKLTCRTDATTFMPLREGFNYFQDPDAVNLKYCEDMVAMDIGHMTLKNVAFLEYMPNLEYLILAHTDVRDLSPISNCKKLRFLELDYSPVPDFTPLLGCTALEDLNIGNTYADVEPLLQMTWLKNLWCIKRGGAAAYKLVQGMPETCHVQSSGAYTVAAGWRELPNYYAMRDLLGMHYMK